MEHTQADERIVATQLGRPPRGAWRVAARCHLQIPMVIESHPVLDDGTPFPTTFWLTCPLLVKRAARLEAEGMMTELTEAVARDGGLRARLADAIRRYRDRRDAYALIPDSSPPGGGPDRIKCLHAHVAHELADPPNPAGALTLAATGFPDCRSPCVTETP